MSELEHICNVIENGGIETAINIRTVKQSKFIKVLQLIKNLIFGTSREKEENIN